LLRGFDVPTISQVTGKALRTIAQYLVIVECYQPDLLQASHHQWMVDRRKGKSFVAPPETLAAMTEALSNPKALDGEKCDKISGGESPEPGAKKRPKRRRNPVQRGDEE
jgi:hypothetical protein